MEVKETNSDGTKLYILFYINDKKLRVKLGREAR